MFYLIQYRKEMQKKHEHFLETNLSIIIFWGKFFGKNGEDIN